MPQTDPTDLETVPAAPAPPPRPRDGHKGTFGTVIVVGGCATMIGAPAIAARAACRSGVGLVKIAAERAVLPFALTIEPSATGCVLEDAASVAAADPRRAAVLAVGPGFGDGHDELVLALLDGPRAMVLDADGLNALARSGRAAQRAAPLILTPHPGEFRRLAEPLDIALSPTDPGERSRAAAALAQAHDGVVVLKGADTVVSDGRRVYVNQTGNVALATAGSGDVLTGVAAALLAAGMTPFDAAVLAVYAHGLAADAWSDRHGPAGLRAQDLADELPLVFKALRR